MDPELPLGAWTGFWAFQGEPLRHLMKLEVHRAGKDFQAGGEDEQGSFSLTGTVPEWGEESPWMKSYLNGHQTHWKSTRVHTQTGFVGRWRRSDGAEGEFAIWPGTSTTVPDALLNALPADQISARCVCGETLDLPAEAVGLEIECPYCLQIVLVPAGGGQATAFVPPPEEPEPADAARCSSCASPAAAVGAACVLCGGPTVPPEAIILHPDAFDQELVSPETADWIFRKFAWLIRTQGLEETLRRPPLIPSKDWHPELWTGTETETTELLRVLQRNASLDGTDLELQVLADEDLALLNAPGAGKPDRCHRAPAREDSRLRVRIAHHELPDRLTLIGSFAHGLGHLHLEEKLLVREPLPDDHEFLADLVAITLGFGLFTCDASFRFHTWSASRRGGHYGARQLGALSQPDLCFAMALWARLRGMDGDAVPPHLGVNSRSYFKNAFQSLDDRPELLGSLKAGKLL